MERNAAKERGNYLAASSPELQWKRVKCVEEDTMEEG
jgi:hypothetical protein